MTLNAKSQGTPSTLPNAIALQINAFTGDHRNSRSTASAKGWLLRHTVERPPTTAAPRPPDLADWRDERVGWGIVLPAADLSNDDLARAVDAPEPIRRLVEQRQPAPVFRYDADLFAKGFLKRCDVGCPPQDVYLGGGGDRGTGRGCLPYYLLILGGPNEVPWSVQYDLNGVAFVGRLHLKSDALERYVEALLCDWCNVLFPVGWNRTAVWAPVHHADDITQLMRDSIAARVQHCLCTDSDIGPANARFIDGNAGDATADSLAALLAEHRPGIVVTTSHGMTGPLHDPTRMAAQLGLLVGSEDKPIPIEALTAEWCPSGAIWYAHACCSAGSGGAPSAYDGLFDPKTTVGGILNGIASLSAAVAPLPSALLSASKPLRAFVGHVEPTFDCTLRQYLTQQQLTQVVVRALYEGLCAEQPVGLAFSGCYTRLAALSSLHERALKRFNCGAQLLLDDLTVCITAHDLRTMVILGDPTVRLRKL